MKNPPTISPTLDAKRDGFGHKIRERLCEKAADGLAGVVEEAPFVKGVRQHFPDAVAPKKCRKAANACAYKGPDAGADYGDNGANSRACGRPGAHHADLCAAGDVIVLGLFAGGLGALEYVNKAADDTGAAQQAASDGCRSCCCRACGRGRPRAQGPADAAEGASDAPLDCEERSVGSDDAGRRPHGEELA